MTDKITVFIVEDDEQMVHLLSDFIQRKFPEFVVETFTHGEEAVENLHLNPQVVILDYFLHNKNAVAMDGLSVFEKIRQHNKSTRVVFLSAQEDPDVAATAIKMGAYDYIVKNKKSFDRLEIILSHFKSHLVIDNKAILKKLYVVLLIVVILALVIYTISKMEK